MENARGKRQQKNRQTKDCGPADGKQVNKMTKLKMKENENENVKTKQRVNRKLQLGVVAIVE